jgi:hypothetical protein
MRFLFTILILFCSLISRAQNAVTGKTFISIDHVPIVVRNLDSIKSIFSELLHFHIKEGKRHEGIKNCFIKFQDGTYLEFVSPVDRLHSIGNYYAECLKSRQGATALAVSVTNADLITANLKSKSISFSIDSNAIWKTISPQGVDLFFIDYLNKSWKETTINTTHPNHALLLQSVYMISVHLEADIKKLRSLGFDQVKDANYSGIPCKQIIIGKRNLYLFDAYSANKLTSAFTTKNVQGICGVEIKVRSLSALNKQLVGTHNIKINKNKTTYYLKGYNFFIEFSE